jgi:Xaa-Pro aminopeptidase
VIREATIRDNTIYSNGSPLTSEKIKQVIHVALMERDCVGQHTIVASGIQGCDPHNEGSGPLQANTSIIMDIFPRSSETRYFADQTRTVVKGKASDELRRLYDTVKEAQQAAVDEVRDGVNGNHIHQRICERFEAAGYATGPRDGRMQGFFHGTGHGVGLDIHEPPRLGKTQAILRAGQVVTIEPGLYYPDIGAVRIEDMVLVTETGCRNLTKFPKFLEIE